MNRRRFLTLSAVSLSLTGCMEGDFGDPEVATPECGPSMCEGTTLVKVVNASSGVVAVQADCRDEGYTLQSRESVEITREEDAESCRIGVFLDEKQVYSEEIEDYESLTLTIRSDGEVETDWVVR
jgi:hypothetical protein